MQMLCHCGHCCIDPGYVWSGCSRPWSVLWDCSVSMSARRSWRCLYRFQRSFSFSMLQWCDCPFCSMCIWACGVRFLVWRWSRGSEFLQDLSVAKFRWGIVKSVPECFLHLHGVVDIVDQWKELITASEMYQRYRLIGSVMAVRVQGA